jgi:hypothetical protein
LSVTICYQPLQTGVKTVDSTMAFFDTLKRVAGHSGFANEFIVGRANLDRLRMFRDALESDSVDYKSTTDIIEAIEMHGDVRVWGSFSGR